MIVYWVILALLVLVAAGIACWATFRDRYVLVEINIFSGEVKIVSWHATYAGASLAGGEIVAHYVETKNREILDRYRWRAVPRSEVPRITVLLPAGSF